MITLLSFAVSLSIIWVWIINSKSVQKEFENFDLSAVTMIWVGLSKIAFSVLLLAGLFWSDTLLIISANALSLFMLAAQYFHQKFNSPFKKRLPSAILLLASLFITYYKLIG